MHSLRLGHLERAPEEREKSMRRHGLALNTLAVILTTLVLAPAAHAQATRTWVSGVGDDANPCSRTAPCKTFAGAISKTAAGGEISVLDPGGFGAVTITKAITLSGDGTLAGILAAGTNGIIVNAGVNDRVVLRSLSIDGAGTGLNGIRFLAGKSLTVDNCTISGFTTRGIDMTLSAAAKMSVTSTRITNAPTGIFATASAGQAQVVLDDVNLTGLTNGVEGGLGGRFMISSSIISGNTGTGVLGNASSTRINVEGSQISFNDVAGVNSAVAGAIIRLSNNQIYNNNAGIISSPGTVESAGNNRVAGNVSSPAAGGSILFQ